MQALAMLQTGLAGVLMALGCFFICVAAIGLVRLPDFYSRMHATGKSDTLGQLLVLLGLIVYSGPSMVSAKLLLIAVFITIANPTATHAVARAAYVVGKPPWKKGDKRR